MTNWQPTEDEADRIEYLVERLCGTYRIPITDGLGPAGGDEPENATEFVRHFEVPPIQIEAAETISYLMARLAASAK